MLPKSNPPSQNIGLPHVKHLCASLSESTPPSQNIPPFLQYTPFSTDPGFEKGGGAGGLGARPQEFFGQFSGFKKKKSAKKGGVRPLWIRA